MYLNAKILYLYSEQSQETQRMLRKLWIIEMWIPKSEKWDYDIKVSSLFITE